MLRDLGIRWKILAVLALPVLVLVLGAGVISASAVGDANRAGQVEKLASASGEFSQLIRGLQTERALSVAVLSGDASQRKALDQVRTQVSKGLKQVRQLIDDVRVNALSTGASQAIADSQGEHQRLLLVRQQVDNRGTTAARAGVDYTNIIAADVELPGKIALSLDDPSLAQDLADYTQLERIIELATQEQQLGSAILAQGSATPSQARELASYVALQTAALNTYTAGAGVQQAAALQQAYAKFPQAAFAFDQARGAFTKAGTSDVSGLSPQDWTTVSNQRLALFASLERPLAADATDLASQHAAGASSRAALLIVLAIALVVLPVVLALFLSRRITRPLRRLRDAATHLSNELPRMVEQMRVPGEGPNVDLPEIPVEGNDEVGQLAAAFNGTNATTVRVAQEQAALRASIAEMFVNVARRDQVLLSRQLAFIDQLERTEENPDTLEDLFKLDHLATRMRRNAESLLVLAGIDSGRRLRRPMPLADVIRTASSEIEQYDRVDLALQADPPMTGHVALSAAHLLAELLENATNFSDPGSRVVVATALDPHGISVTITDVGLGMSPEEMATAHSRIEESSAADVVGEQRLGFFVVGRLARRLDARVILRAGRDHGTVVKVVLPASLFVPGSVLELPPAVEEATDHGSAPSAGHEIPLPSLAELAGAVASAPPLLPPAFAPAADVPVPAAERSTETLPRRGERRRARADAKAAAAAAAETAESTPTHDTQVEDDGGKAELSEPKAPTRGGFLPRRRRGSDRAPEPVDPLDSDKPLDADKPLDGDQPVDGVAAAVTSTELTTPASLPAPAVPQPSPALDDAPPPSQSRGGLFGGFRSRREPVAPVPTSPTVPEQFEPVAQLEPESLLPEALSVEAFEATPVAASVEETPAEQTVVLEPITFEVAPEPEPITFEPEPITFEPEPEPQPETDFEPVADPEPESQPQPVAEVEPVAEVAPEPVAEPEPGHALPRPARASLDILPTRGGRARSGGLFRRGRREAPAPLMPPPGRALRPAQPSSAPTFGRPDSAPLAPAADTRLFAAPPEPRTEQPAHPPAFGAPTSSQWASTAQPSGGAASPAVEAPTTDQPTHPEVEAVPAVPAQLGDVLRQRSALASQALSELSQLSTYRPSNADGGSVPLTRRTPQATPAAVIEQRSAPGTRRNRNAADVRSMLSGYQAGVERARTSPSAQRPVAESDAPDQPAAG